MAGGFGLGVKQDLLAGKPSDSLATHSFKCCPSQARLKICLVWSAVRFKVETDTDGNVMGPVTDETPAWIGALADEMGQDLPP